MSVAKRIEEAIAKMPDAEAALIPTSIAVASTAQRMFPGERDNRAYKRFVSENLVLITRVAFQGTAIGQMRVVFAHPELRPASDGTVTIEQVLYHVVRCGLIHSAALPTGLQFADGNIIGVDPATSTLTLPKSLIYGLLISVVVAAVNSAERVNNVCTLTWKGNQIKINDLWGNSTALSAFLATPRRR